MFTHAGRIAFAQAAEYYWTSTTKFLSASFDQFYFTDPPNSTPDYANDNGTNSLLQDIVYVPETPFGTGSIGSIAAGELFCVKHQKGGYIVSGDPTSPTVTWLGGVQPTYGADCVAAASPIGLIYMSAKNGAWLWNGGSQSIKVSTQLNDDFWTGAPQPPSIGPAFSLAVLGDLVFFPNNYVYNTTSNSWWIMDNQAIQYCWYGVGSDGDTVYCSPSIVPYAGGTTANQIFAYKYQLTTPATTYQWKSYPLPPTVEPEYSVTIREVVIRAQGIGTITPTFTSNNGLTGAGGTTASTTPASITLSSLTTPVRTVLTTGLINANDVCIAITSTGTGGNPAPVIYSIDIAYEKQNRLNAT